jgi:hypothetical protein
MRIGDQVAVTDGNGNVEARGMIVGLPSGKRYAEKETLVDVQPRGDHSLAKRLCGIPVSRIRIVGKPVLAFERQVCEPTHMFEVV